MRTPLGVLEKVRPAERGLDFAPLALALVLVTPEAAGAQRLDWRVRAALYGDNTEFFTPYRTGETPWHAAVAAIYAHATAPLRRLADRRALGHEDVVRAGGDARALLQDWFEAGWLHRVDHT